MRRFGMVEQGILGFIDSLQQYGEMAWFPLGLDGEETFVVMTPELVEEVLVTHRHAFVKGRGLQRIRMLLGDGLLTSEGEVWKRHRQLMAPKFHRRAIGGYAAEFVRTTREHVDGLRDGEVIDVAPWFMQLTLDITLRSLFGRTLGHEMGQISAALSDVLEWFAVTTPRLVHLPTSVPTPLNRRLLAGCATLRDTVRGIIEARRRSGSESEDLLGLLIAARDEDGGRLSEEELVDEVLTILLAGHETTAQALTFTIDLLSRHPAARERAIAEACSLEPGQWEDPLALRELRWIDACMREAMRIWPPAPLTAREAVEPVTIGGWEIPVRGQVLIPMITLHRSPRIWDDPMAFLPERWLQEPALHRFAYMPFGGGHRVCIGDAFARLEIVAVLVHLLRRFRPVAVSDRPPGVIPSVTIRPDGPVRVRWTTVAPPKPS
jgi:cytochrome P450